jgi:aminocarboxymuconate-semialdehyde decarboxylase
LNAPAVDLTSLMTAHAHQTVVAETPGAIDVHTHVVPGHFPPYTGCACNIAWPSMVDAGACHRHVVISGRVFRTVPEVSWNAAARCAEMDRLRVARQVLSPMPELLSYWLDAADAQVLLRFVNEQIAALVAGTPQRFFGLAGVPLQDIDLAIEELRHAVESLGLSGVEIAGCVNGRPIGAPEFEPFWDAVHDLDAAVFVHPLRPAAMERLVGPRPLEQLLAFPSDTGLALASLITGGVLERHPRLRIAGSHGGGTLHALLPRLQHGWTLFDELRETMPTAPVELARRLYVDALVYDDAAIGTLLGCFGAGQLMLGSDFPFSIQDPDPVARIERVALDPDLRTALSWRNAQRWLQRGRTDTPPHT